MPRPKISFTSHRYGRHSPTGQALLAGWAGEAKKELGLHPEMNGETVGFSRKDLKP